MRHTLFDPRICTLGEGALWHPERGQAFWFDILGKRLLSRHQGRELSWQFDEPVSAAGWIDRDSLLIASASALFRFHLGSGARESLVALEADRPGNRSNDGRADPWGGFWIGTMGLDASPGAGAIYRWFDGRLERLRDGMDIPNAICFDPAGRHAYFADTARQIVWRQPLDARGWPVGEPAVYLDLTGTDQHPDGAVTDARGNFWNARWGSGTLVCHAPDGTRIDSVTLPSAQVSCPAFIGENLDRILVTSAAEGLDGAQDGRTWLVLPDGARGLAEPQVRP